MGTITESDFAAAWRTFREVREARLRAPHGFLAATGLHWLDREQRRYDDVPGAWSVGPGGIVVELREDERLSVAGAPLRGRHVLGHVDELGLLAEFGNAVVEVAARSGRVFLRPRHPEAAGRLTYTSTPAFDPDESWVVTGTLHPYDAPRPVGLDTVVEGMESVLDAVGEIRFSVLGREQRLVAFEDGEGSGYLWVLFTDETSGVTTYAATRQLEVPPPAPDGTVVLDFNRALNMPCAYTAYATCPLPPLGNHVDVMVEAGEKTPPRVG